MPGKRVRNFGLLVLSIAGLVAAFSGTAAASGPPSFGGSTWAETYLSATDVTFSGIKVNPNGAATEVRTEYSDGGTALATPWQNIGSGTSSVTVPQTVAVKPYDIYTTMKVVAKNSYGTVETKFLGGEEFESPVWIAPKGGAVSSFQTGGTFTLEYHVSVVTGKIECNASGSGVLGHKAAEGDYYNVTLSSCSYYQNGKFVCHPKEPLFSPRFNGAFLAEPGTETMRFQYCPGEETTQVLSTGPYALTLSKQPLVVHPMTLTASGTINGGWAATVTISGNMSLSGEHSGQEFYWVPLI